MEFEFLSKDLNSSTHEIPTNFLPPYISACINAIKSFKFRNYV